MKKKSYRFIGLIIIAAFLMALPSVASASLSFPILGGNVNYNPTTNILSGSGSLGNFSINPSTNITNATITFTTTGSGSSSSWMFTISGIVNGSGAATTLFTGSFGNTLTTANGYSLISNGFTLNPTAYGLSSGAIQVFFNAATGAIMFGGLGFDDPAETPIPAAFLLFGSGLFGLVCIRRRKK